MNNDTARKKYLAAKLAANTATEAERNEALGTILLSLWSKEDVEKVVEEKHVALCKDCPARKAVEGGSSVWGKLMFELIKLVGLALVVLGSVAGAAKYAEAIAKGVAP